MTDGEAYRPLNVLKPVDDDVWIVDGPAIGFGIGGLKFPFSTRMTIVRLDGRLFIHSPTPLEPGLRAQIEAIGIPAWIIGPSTIHYWWIPDWAAAFPAADVYLANGIVARSKGRIDLPFKPLADDRGYPWDDGIAALPIVSHAISEVEFFHHRSRTLILTDLIENFESERLQSAGTRFLAWLGGILHPHGSMPRDMRLTFFGRRKQLRRAVQRMIDWDPHRVILAHGRWYEQDGREELIRAFGWLLQGRQDRGPRPRRDRRREGDRAAGKAPVSPGGGVSL